MLMSPLAGWLSDHLDKSRLATLGLLISSTGLFLLSATGADTNLSTFTAYLALLGGGQALFLSPNSAAVLAHCPRKRTGTTAALLATARNLGMLLGIALATLIFTMIFSHLTGGLDLKDFRPDQTLAFLAAWRGTMLVAGGIGIVGILASGLRGKSPDGVFPADTAG
jgi:MFS family permease